MSPPLLRAIKPMGEVTRIGKLVTDTSRLTEELAATVAEGYPTVDGPHYQDVLRALHLAWRPDWYLEIGTFTGSSLKHCLGKFIAIDPDFRFEKLTMGNRQEGHFFQVTSDAFFDGGFLARNGIQPDLGFLDGLHTSDALMRDFLNFEAAGHPGSRAVLHDCLPWNEHMAGREHNPKKSRAWTGDVWKVLPVLEAHRPDLTVTVLDAYPTGLVVIENLDPSRRDTDAAMLSEIDAMRETSLQDYGLETYFGTAAMTSAYRFVEAKGGPISLRESEAG